MLRVPSLSTGPALAPAASNVQYKTSRPSKHLTHSRRAPGFSALKPNPTRRRPARVVPCGSPLKLRLRRSRVGGGALVLGRVQQRLLLGRVVLAVDDLPVDAGDGRDVELVRGECGGVTCLGEDLDGEGEGVLERDHLLLVLLLHERHGGLVVGADARGLPTVVVAARVRLVQLEPVRLVPPRVEHRHTKRAEAAILRVRLLLVRELLDELLHRLRLLVGEAIALRVQSSLVDEDVGVGGDAGDGAGDVLVDEVHLLRAPRRLQKLRGQLLLRRQHNAVAREDAQRSARVRDRLHGVLHLVQSPLGREDCRP
mmetsp:Transcript_51463/g.142425  ORF Transcript_51463/g.142425 Transcript_51463/m.142425 type:complete len:312 (-) Transcript_51463:78-1013(-)